jgi:hypothetical protein
LEKLPIFKMLDLKINCKFIPDKMAYGGWLAGNLQLQQNLQGFLHAEV